MQDIFNEGTKTLVGIAFFPKEYVRVQKLNFSEKYFS